MKQVIVASLSMGKVILPILIVACGEGDNSVFPETGTVRRTMTYPAPALGKEWVVIVDHDFNGGNGWVGSASGHCASGRTLEYSVIDLPAGTYYVYALVRVTSGPTDSPEAGDYLGIHGGSIYSPPQGPTATVPSGGVVICNITLDIYPGD
jgi:hypothetical protein